MTLQIFPEYLKECNQIIFKLIYSNSGQLKQTTKKVPCSTFSWEEKNLYCSYLLRRAIWAGLKTESVQRGLVCFTTILSVTLESSKGHWAPLGAAKVFHRSDSFVIPLFGFSAFFTESFWCLKSRDPAIDEYIEHPLWRSHRLVWSASWVEYPTWPWSL